MAIRVAAVLLAFSAAIPCLAQTPQSDSQTLQAILAEIRAIHQEVKTTQSTQILLTELGIQQSVVNRATQRVDDAQSRLSEIKSAERDTGAEQAREKDRLDQSTDPQEAKALADRIEGLKRQAVAFAAME